MPTRGPIPSTFTGVNDYFNTVTPYMNTNGARLRISPPDLVSLNELYDNDVVVLDNQGWSQLWPQYSNKATVNDTIREVVRKRRKS